MPELPKLSDLLADAIGGHGKTTADLFRRLDQDEEVDLAAETVQCLGDLAQTGARFFLFWDNIATLLAAEGKGPALPHPGPLHCAEGEIHDFVLEISGVDSAEVTTGLRRRGESQEEIAAGAIQVNTTNDQVTLTVDCSGVARGLYEGTLSVTTAGGRVAPREFNVYIDPKPRP